MTGTTLEDTKELPSPTILTAGGGRSTWLLPGLGAAGLLIGLAWPVFGFWWREFTAPDSFYSHGPLVPLMAALLLWHRRVRLCEAPKTTSPAVLALLVPVTLLLVQTVRIDSGWVASLAFLLILTCCAWLFLGGRWMRAAWPAFVLLLLMSPLPGTLLNQATLGLQVFSTSLAVHLLNLVGFRASADGTLITLPGFTLWVAAACSGFKLLLSLLTFGAAFVSLLDGPPVRRLGLFLALIPLSLGANAVRIAAVAGVGVWQGPTLAQKVDAQGAMLTLSLSFGALYLLAKGAKCRTLAGWPLF